MYDTREKAARDHQWLINGARNEGLVQGNKKGAIIGTIRTCQAILGLAESDIEDLRSISVEELKARASQLQTALRGRSA